MAEQNHPNPDIVRARPLPGPDPVTGGLISDHTLYPTDGQMAADGALLDSFRALAENAPDMIARLDGAQRYIYVNPAIEELTGLPARALLGKTNRELWMPQPLAGLWEEQVGAVLRTGDKRQFLFSAALHGQERHYDARVAPEPGADGVVESVLVIVRDVTERERTRLALQNYASRLYFLHEVDDAIRAARSAEEVAEAALPYAQRLLPCQRASVALYDWQAHEALVLAVRTEQEPVAGKGHRMPLERNWLIDELATGRVCYVPDLSVLDSADGTMAALRAAGARSLVTVPLLVPEGLIGSLNLWMASPEPLTTEQQEIAQEIGSHLAVAVHQARLHDQVQRHAQELEASVARRTAALEASQARFLAIFENAAIGIALLDAGGHVITSNPALQQMLGYTSEELQTMTVYDFVHPEDRPQRDALFQELMAGQRSHFTVEKRYLRKDGTTLWVQPTVSLVRTTQGPGRLAIKMVQDITEQRRAREALIQAERLTIAGKIGASLAHEISNPLQSVLGALGLAEEMVTPQDDIHRYLRIAIDELRRAAGMVAQLRTLNRASTPSQRMLVHPRDVIDGVVLLTRKQCQNANVSVYWDVSPDLPELMVVPDRIRQVFLNLVLNAVGVMADKGQLRIEARETHEPRGVQFDLTDTGRGIDPGVLPYLFEPFRTTKSDGLGLGLYISKGIVEDHGGRIDVVNRPGEGATFSVWLPVGS